MDFNSKNGLNFSYVPTVSVVSYLTDDGFSFGMFFGQ